MAQVTIKINGYAYTVGCEDGQEEHLQAMAAEIERRIGGIRALGGQSGEARLLVLAALLMADELHDLGEVLLLLQDLLRFRAELDKSGFCRLIVLFEDLRVFGV